MEHTSSLESIEEPNVSIHLDQAGPIQPMGTVSGKVTLIVKHEKITRGVMIQCNGEAIVKFTSLGKHRLLWRRSQVKPKVHMAKEVFAHAWKYVLGGARIREYKLTPGTQTFPFSFILPPKLSCSYRGKYGRVEYRIDVKIRGFREAEKDQVTSAVFQVFAPVDLNDYHDAWHCHSIVANAIKSKCGLPCEVGLIGFVFELPRTGFMPGEIIHFSGEVVNTTKDWKVEDVQVRLLQSELFAAEGEMTWIKTPIYVISYPGVACGRIDIWEGPFGPIPNVLPTKLGNCHIIRVSYWLQVVMIYTKAKSKKRRYISEIREIIIGNVRFSDEVQEQYHQEQENEIKQTLRRKGLRYRTSSTDILGNEPNIGYFVHYGERVGDFVMNDDNEARPDTILDILEEFEVNGDAKS